MPPYQPSPLVRQLASGRHLMSTDVAVEIGCDLLIREYLAEEVASGRMDFDAETGIYTMREKSDTP